jgi:tetratricopeptide (TPR) repeat protein
LILDTNEKSNAVGLEALDRVAAGDLAGARLLLDWVREDQHLEGGDDPLAGEPFPRFWTKGKEGDANQLNLAAAALLVQTKPTAKRGLEILEAARKTTTGDIENTNLNLALASGYSNTHDYANLLIVASALAKQYPESRYAFFLQTSALRDLKRFDESDALVQQRLKRMPDDIDALRVSIANHVAREDYRGAYEQGRKIMEAGKAEAVDLNGVAWETLFFSRAEGPDVDSAIKASQMLQKSPAILHTLGSVYAEVGKVKEAHEVLIQAMDLLNLSEPNPDYWYAFGRIAEQYGETQVAKSLYEKATKPTDPMRVANSSYTLAQARLKNLGASH